MWRRRGLVLRLGQAAIGGSRAMAQMKAAISRATAITAWLGFLPRAVSRR